MTAVQSPPRGDVARPAAAGGGDATPGGAPPRSPRDGRARRVGAAVVAAAMALGALLGVLGAFGLSWHYHSTATVVFTTADPGHDNPAKGSRYIQERLPSYAAVAESDGLRPQVAAAMRAAGGPVVDPDAFGVVAVPRSGTELVEITAASDDPRAAVAEATATATVTGAVVGAGERLPTGEPRLTAQVMTPGTAPLDFAAEQAQWWAVLGLVAGFVVGLTTCTLIHPGRWARDLAPQRVTDRREAVDLNARALGDELQALVRGVRGPVGLATIGVAALAVAGYGLTGWAVFPLLPVLAAAVWSAMTRDPRWSVAALLFVGVGVFPEKVDLIKLGPVTPTVLELALLLALVLAARFAAARPRSVFFAPVLGIAGAAVVGSVVGIVRGGEFSLVSDSARAILVVLGFFPVYLAFARRPHQLVALLLSLAGVCSSVVLVAAAAGWSRLLVDERGSVLTGSTSSSVARLSGPTLDLWAPLLILLASAFVPRRPRWLWLSLVVVGVGHMALSFNRSTWAPLIVLIVAVAAITHGTRGVLTRLGALVAVGAIGLTLALTGLLGHQGTAIANRATSVVTGKAYGEDSLPDRMRENGAATMTLRKSPYVGVGMGQTYGGELVTYDKAHSRVVVSERPYIHNQYLRIWLYMGLVGLLAYAFAGVRVLALVAHSWWRRSAGGPMVVAIGMGLLCLAAQAILQTTLVARPNVLTVATMLAAATGFAVWTPRRGDGPSDGLLAATPAAGGSADGGSSATGSPAGSSPADGAGGAGDRSWRASIRTRFARSSSSGQE